MVTALARVGGQAARRDRQRPVAPGRRDRRPRSRQGGPIHAALRRLRAPDPVAVRHARIHGRTRRPSGPPPSATSRGCSSPAPTSKSRSARSCCARATGSALRRWPEAASRRGCSASGWPTSEFGGMGLEGAVRLGMRRELEAIEDARERERAYEAMVAAAYERGGGINMAAYGEIDDVIDPADSSRWIEHAVRRGLGRVVEAAGQAPAVHRRLVGATSRSPRTRRGAPPRGDRRARRGAADTRLIARSSPGSSNATQPAAAARRRGDGGARRSEARARTAPGHGRPPRARRARARPADPVPDRCWRARSGVPARAARPRSRRRSSAQLWLASSSITRSRAPPRRSPARRSTRRT